MELATTPYAFEMLLIESVAFFFVVFNMALFTWRSFNIGEMAATSNREFWTVIFVAGFLILASTFCYLLGADNFVFALELAFALMLAVLRPANALALFICLTFLRPWEIEANPLFLALPRMTGLLALASAGAAYMRSDLNRIKFGRSHWFLVAFALWTLATTFITPNPSESQGEYFNTFFRALIVFFLIVAVVRSEMDLSLFRQIYLWSVAGLAAVSTYVSWDQLGNEGADSTDRLHAIGSLENANDIAAILIIGIPFALRRISDGKRNPFAWMEGLFFLGLTLFGLYMAQSRGALLALGAGGLGWWVLRSKRQKTILIVGLLIGACVVPFANEILRRNSEDLRESKASRLNYWKAGVKMVIRSPAFGVGFGRYPKEYQGYAGDGEQYEFGERTAHSTWVLALAETGVPGLAFLLCFVLGVFRMGKRIIPTEPDLFVALLAYLIAISFLSHTYLIYPYILMGMVVAAYRVHYRSSKGWGM